LLFQTVKAEAVSIFIVIRHQSPDFGIKDKQESIQQDQTIVVDSLFITNWIEVIGGIFEEAISQDTQGVVHPLFEVFLHPHRIGDAFIVDKIEECRFGVVGLKGLTAEEKIKVFERFRVILFNEFYQIHLIEAVHRETGIAIVQPPLPAIGQNTPPLPSGQQVVIDLYTGIGGVFHIPALTDAPIQRAIPVFSIANSQCVLEIFFLAL